MTTSRVLRLRAMTSETYLPGMRLCRAAGWNQLEEDWRVFLASAKRRPGCERARGGNSRVPPLRSFAWIAMMLVDRKSGAWGLARS